MKAFRRAREKIRLRHAGPRRQRNDLLLRRSSVWKTAEPPNEERQREYSHPCHFSSNHFLTDSYATVMFCGKLFCPAQSAYSGILSSFLISSNDFPWAAISPTRLTS